MKILLIILSLPIALYALLLLFAYLFADSLMFHPPSRTYVKTSEHVFFKGANGSDLVGVFLKADNPKFNIIYCHGNGEDIGMVYPFLHALRQNGYNVFSFDYNGYGYSTGKPTEKNLYLSCEAAWKYAKENLNFAPENTMLMGFSLGSAAICHISTLEKNWLGAIISGGISKGVTTILPVNIIPWSILDNQSKIAKFKSPLLLLHGTRDMIVAPRNAKMNYDAAQCPKKLVMLEGFNHNDIFSSPDYWNEIQIFLKSLKK